VIPYARQHIDQEDIDSVVAVLRSDFLTQGQQVPRFERHLAEYVGVPHAVAFNSATSALHVACLALGLGPGDSLWTAANTFVASANCALYCGASVDFVDIDPDTYNMSVTALEAKLAVAAGEGRLPKIVVPVHFAGQPCDMGSIAGLADRYGFHVIEDASHAIGATVQGAPVGRCEGSAITVFSFHPVKIITTAEGGMAVSRNGELAARMQLLRSHGITRDRAAMSGLSEGSWYYEQVALGFNYRMTELQAALGTSQLQKIDQFISRRRQVAAAYDSALADLPLKLPATQPGATSALHLYPVQCSSGGERRRVFEGLRNAGILANVHYIPVYLHPYYRGLGFERGLCPVAESYYDRAISLPMYPDLSQAQIDRVDTALRDLFHT
jgi:UDP-4-amino-4,6-dideoxy-N-acetyl-beta-L-altrosamine transaminase